MSTHKRGRSKSPSSKYSDDETDNTSDFSTQSTAFGFNKLPTIIVRNIHYHLTMNELKEEFRMFRCVYVKMPVDLTTKRGKGFAFLSFEDEKDAEAALKYVTSGQCVIMGRELNGDWSTGPKTCYRCGKIGHTVHQCNEKITTDFRDKHSERDNSPERHSSKHDKHKDKDREKDGERSKEREKEKDKDRHKHREKEDDDESGSKGRKDKHKDSSSSKHSSHSLDDKMDKDKSKDKDKNKEKAKDSSASGSSQPLVNSHSTPFPTSLHNALFAISRSDPSRVINAYIRTPYVPQPVILPNLTYPMQSSLHSAQTPIMIQNVPQPTQHTHHQHQHQHQAQAGAPLIPLRQATNYLPNAPYMAIPQNVPQVLAFAPTPVYTPTSTIPTTQNSTVQTSVAEISDNVNTGHTSNNGNTFSNHTNHSTNNEHSDSLVQSTPHSWKGMLYKSKEFICNLVGDLLTKEDDIQDKDLNLKTILPQSLEVSKRTPFDQLAMHIKMGTLQFHVMQLTPESEKDNFSYNSFVSYLVEKKRAGVVESGGVVVYLVPPDAQLSKVLGVTTKKGIMCAVITLPSNTTNQSPPSVSTPNNNN
eukprot:TRINITY_DN7309_c0_g1_i1.p1 TRINITY_DN7309_c0_g1~~TRINITY_DN7309_c0_g1_i1.p1  ORF type:complete len:586 (-),score=98.84 TRINITY_DN7309_c0_g1_i1:59-1816(-)